MCKKVRSRGDHIEPKFVFSFQRSYNNIILYYMYLKVTKFLILTLSSFNARCAEGRAKRSCI